MASATVDPQTQFPVPIPPPSPSPLDPNFSPPTRPPSALSTTSDASFFELYEESGYASPTRGTPGTSTSHAPEHLPRRMVFSTIRRQGQQCQLCGRKGNAGELVVVRAVLQHEHHETGAEKGTSPDLISGLKALGLLPHGYTRDDWTNLMTLCKPHAEAYDQGVWRWLPGVALREQIAKTAVPVHADTDAKTPSVRPGTLADEEDGDGDVTMSEAEITVDAVEDEPQLQGDQPAQGARAQDTSSLAVQLESTPAETLVDDGISGDMPNPEISFQPTRPSSQVELPSFDVLIFRPELMPSFSADASSSKVLRDWKKLTLNPYVAFSAALRLLGGPDVYPDDDAVLAPLRSECLEVGGRWSQAMPRREREATVVS
ncbi:hypothetical protein L226DRAFT_509223 [Lentinus tigrinus ALCF2SS1-7]|uniref:Uncharacterized protein n=1 Tax=Lentinus tigrinus ALCF2SS1-6 TaxID=1328759 RepID=A0A5C2RU80_9APHY|nr:hypothetical protein L227DRAFT_555569 [Lentinus tigrinus ALCF2SS1-6]RPD74106.1 hypothetical protein L226DRAFT_509223 [Lentinus tigrinus ALCF2SS1-7]